MIDHLIGLLATSGAVLDPARLAADVRTREDRMSTGVGEGLALPHTRTAAVTHTVIALATLATPVDWSALDGAPVEVVLLFAGPEADRAAHVHLLAQVSRVLSADGVRQRLMEARSVAELLEVLARAERRL